jgi:hypothetical protein
MSQILNFFVFNIKLQSNKTGEERTLAYVTLIEKLTQNPYKVFATNKSEAIVMYGAYNTKDNGKSLYLYGRAAKGLYIAGEEKNILKDGEVKIESNNEDELINPIIVRYLFFPDAHRLFVEKKNGGPGQFDIEKLLNRELNLLINTDEILEVILEKDDSTIKEIFAAKVVHSLSFKVSYTNEDFLKDLADEFDKELKDTNIGELSVTAKADNHIEGLKIDSSPLLGGGLKLAESNGEIRSASITPNNGKGKIKMISNRNKPKILTLKMEDSDNFWDKWYKNVLKIYRGN